jgi:hypothetical protein
MKRAFLYLVILTVTSSMALQISSAADGNVKVRHTVIAASGDAAPAGGNYLASSFSNVRLNARHDVVFDAGVGSTTGVFVGDGKTTSTIELGDNGSVSNPFITPNGDVVFNVNNADIYRTNGKSIVPLVRIGDTAPGGGTLVQTLERVTNDNGVVAYTAFVSDSAATQGIFRSDGTQSVAIARDDVSTPTGGSLTLVSNGVINDRGQVAFYSNMTGGSAEFGIFRGEGGDLTPIFVSNQIAPGGTTFADFGNPVINNHGQIATTRSLNNNTSGVFVGDGTDTVAIAVQGQPAPKSTSYSGQFIAPTRLNDQGEVAFAARLTGATGASGIFRGDGKQTIPVALTGTNAPGTTGTFASLRDFQFLNDGRVALIATLTVGAGGVNATNNMGIWIGKSDEDLQLVVRTGDVIGGRVLTRLPQFSQGANQFDINENDVLWVGTFGIAKAVVLSRLIGNDDEQ